MSLHGGQGEGSRRGLFYQSTRPIHEDGTPVTQSTRNPITLGIRLHTNASGHTNLQSLSPSQVASPHIDIFVWHQVRFKEHPPVPAESSGKQLLPGVRREGTLLGLNVYEIEAEDAEAGTQRVPRPPRRSDELSISSTRLLPEQRPRRGETNERLPGTPATLAVCLGTF